MDWIKTIPFINSKNAKADRYLFYDFPYWPFPFDFTFDISSNPFIIYGSTIFVAMQFALYGHPRRIYIVGCDCSKGHSSAYKEYKSENAKADFDDEYINSIIDGWKKMKKIQERLYPDIEIISVNPIGLKGIFTDLYQNEDEEN